MRHSEISQAPGHGRSHAQQAVAGSGICCDIISLHNIEVTRKRFCVFHHDTHAARLVEAEKDDRDEGNGHDDTLDQVCRRDSEESAHRRIEDDDQSAEYHGNMILDPEQAVEKSADSLESGRCVRNEEYNDDQSCHD